MSNPDTLDDSTLAAFAEDFSGETIAPDDTGYDDARTVWNAAVDEAPAVVCRCSGTADVIDALAFAREQNLPVSIKSTGHNVAGTAVCDDSVVIDVGPMEGVRVDPDAETARVQPGTTWGKLDHETQAFGLATPGAQAPSVGVVGTTLGGGIGWLSRKYGLTVDNVLSADVVTPQGELVHASSQENPDLFWALRGGGGLPGIVTSLELDLHEIGTSVLAGSLFYPLDEARTVLRQYRDYIATAPREVFGLVSIREVPSAPHVPTERRGTRGVLIGVCYTGDPDQGKRALAPLRDFGDAFADTVRRRPYTTWQQAGASPEVARTSHRSRYFTGLPDEALDEFVDHTTDVPSSEATAYFLSHGGAVTDVASDATAYPHRESSHLLVIEDRWTEPDEDDRHTAWVTEFSEAMKRYGTGGVWINGVSEIVPEAAYRDNHRLLSKIKDDWDPDGLFNRF